MTVRFSLEVLGIEANYRYLTSICNLFEDGRHRWVVEDPGPIRCSPWFQDLGTSERKRFDEILAKSRPPGIDSPICPSVNVGEDSVGLNLSPEKALNLLKQPIYILLENRESDGGFVRQLLLHFGAKELSRRLGRAESDTISKNWRGGDGVFFEVVHGGGDMTEKFYREYVERDDLPRVIAIVDSDKNHPDQPIGDNSTAGKLKAVDADCAPDRSRARLHILRRRNIENYIPVSFLREFAWSNEIERKAAQVYLSMSDDERHFYPFKRGLRASFKNGEIHFEGKDDAKWQKLLYFRQNVHDLESVTTRLKDLTQGKAFGFSARQFWKTENFSDVALENEAGAEFRLILDLILELV